MLLIILSYGIIKMNKSPLISVVILNYNGLKYLKQTIPAVMELDYPNYEVIVVDNGSEDGSIEYLKYNNRIRLVISPKLKEKNFACNYAIQKSNGQFILLLDNDLLITNKNLLYSLVSFYNQLSNVGFITIAFYNEHFTKTKSYGGFFCSYFILENKYRSFSDVKEINGEKVGFPQGANFFFTRKIWDEVGGYDDYLAFGGDDNDIGIKSLLLGYNNFLFSEIINIHIGLLERHDNKKYAEKFKNMFYAHLYTISKNYKLMNLLFYLPIYIFFAFIKSIKQSFQRGNMLVFSAYFKGLFLFLKSFPIAYRKRKEIQTKRRIKVDIFLKIKPARFD